MSYFQTQNAQQQTPDRADPDDAPALPPVAREKTLAVRRDALIQTLSNLDFSAIKEIKGKPSVEFASLAALEQRKQLADRANSVEGSLHGKLDELVKALTENGDKAGAKHAQLISQVIGKAESDAAKAPDAAPVEPDYKSEQTQKMHAALRRLAVEHGYLIDFRLNRGQRLVVPVDALVTVHTAAKPLQACVVGVGGNRECPLTGEMTYGGLALLNVTRLLEYSANSVLANEFAHAHLLVNRGVDPYQPIDANKLPLPKLAPQLAPSLESAFAKLKPASMIEIHELQSDAWSTAVDVKDVDRLVRNGMMMVLGDWHQDRFSEGYKYSAKCAFLSLLSCDLQHGNGMKLRDELFSISTLNKEIASLEAQIRKLDTDTKKAERKEACLDAMFTASGIRSARAGTPLLKSVPESYKQEIAKVLSYYAASFADQAEKLSR